MTAVPALPASSARATLASNAARLEALARRLFMALGPRLHIGAVTPQLVAFFHGAPHPAFAGFGGEVLFADSTALGADGLRRHLIVEALEEAVLAMTLDEQGDVRSNLDGQALRADPDSREGMAFISHVIAQYLREMVLPIAEHRDEMLARGFALSADEAIVQLRNRTAWGERTPMLLALNR